MIRTVWDLERALKAFKKDAPIYFEVNGHAYEGILRPDYVGVILEVNTQKPVAVK